MVFNFFCFFRSLKKLEIDEPEINILINSTNYELLKRFRNAIFHYQKDYFSEKTMNFIESEENPVIWIRALHKKISDWFLEK